VFTSSLSNLLSPLCAIAISTILIPSLPIQAAEMSESLATQIIDFPETLLSQTLPAVPRSDSQRTTPLPTEVSPALPPPDKILPVPPISQPTVVPTDPRNTIIVKKFEIVGSTVFSPAELDKLTADQTNKSINYFELLEAANNITKEYVKNGYLNSGAFIPNNQIFNVQTGIIKIQVVEGSVEDIVVTGTHRLNSNYIKSRIGIGAVKPLKIDRLIESLRLLQLDPLIKSISTELAAGKEPGASVLQLKVTENPTWRAGVNVTNNRTPSVGELQAQASLSQSNLTGAGDGIAVSYGKSEASNILDINYTLPLNPRNGTLKLQYSRSNSQVIETPFDRLDINGTAQDISASYRQPVLQTIGQEFALGFTIANRQTSTGYLASILGERIGYPSPGADAEGNIRLTAARFFQDYTARDTQQVFALRSQVSMGVNALNATIAPIAPDSGFFTWRGQAQYVRSLAPNSIMLLKVEGQVADRALVALEQIGAGGQDTVRGYRQDLLLGDNGLLASAEIRVPVFTPSDSRQILQIVPFLDFGLVSNNNPNPSLPISTIASGGIGLRYQSGDSFFAKLDYGFPFMAITQPKRTGQENGFHFSLGYSQSF
jgi:hemolysin activation/secretion protein